jgi:hypothetical protein
LLAGWRSRGPEMVKWRSKSVIWRRKIIRAGTPDSKRLFPCRHEAFRIATRDPRPDASRNVTSPRSMTSELVEGRLSAWTPTVVRASLVAISTSPRTRSWAWPRCCPALIAKCPGWAGTSRSRVPALLMVGAAITGGRFSGSSRFGNAHQQISRWTFIRRSPGYPM